MPIALPAAAVLAALRSAAEPGTGDDPVHLQAEGIEVLEDYRGAGVPDGHRALLLRLHYAAAARTLTDAEVAGAARRDRRASLPRAAAPGPGRATPLMPC
jgi:phenylalanyl-tRNA synthetase beta chain